MRLDKFLKVSRLIKRRTVANEACDNARVTVNGRPAKASCDVKPGDVLRIKGKGIPYLNGRGSGDLMLKVTVEVPQRLTGEQKELLRAFEASMGEKNYQKRKSFFDKIKKGFR